VHQRLQRSGHEAVIDEDVFLDAELAIPPFEIAGSVVLHTMTQHQVLSPGRCADRVGLDETQPIESALQRRGRKEALGDGETPQVIDGGRHTGFVTQRILSV
jgi:hypothetical protein